MASPQVNMRWPAAITARVDAQCERRNLSRTEYVLEALESFLAMDEAEAEPPTRALRKAAPKARAPLPEVISGAALQARGGTVAKTVNGQTREVGRGGGMVANMDLPSGNIRRPYVKGAGKAKA